MPGRNLQREGAVAYLLERHGIKRTTHTLAKLASVGGGPTFFKFGRTPLYRPEDLDAWVAANTLRAPTSARADRARGGQRPKACHRHIKAGSSATERE